MRCKPAASRIRRGREPPAPWPCDYASEWVQVGTSLKSVRANFDLAGLQPAVVQADANVEDSASRVHHVKTQVQ